MLSKKEMIAELQGCFSSNPTAMQTFAQDFPIITGRIFCEGWKWISKIWIILFYNWGVSHDYILGEIQEVKL